MHFSIRHFSTYDDFNKAAKYENSHSPIDKKKEDLNAVLDDSLFELPPDAPKRVTELAFCDRCGCRLSQYREKSDTHCRACQRALNPLFDKSA